MKNIFKLMRSDCKYRLVSLLTALFFSLTTAQAAPGDLDSTFGSGGMALGETQFQSNEIVVQPDGKIIVAGRVGNVGILMRYNPNGQLDSGFGTGGKIQTFRNFFDVAVQPDGKIVAVADVTQNNLTAIRYNPDGTLDGGFGNGGMINAPAGFSQRAEATAVAVQSDGKILIGGGVQIAKIGRYALFRLNSNGSLDTAFASNGSYQINGGPGARIPDLLIQPDGKILFIAGLGIYRLNADGTSDITFGNSNGIASTIFTENLALQTDGKIVAAGFDFIGTGSSTVFAVARLNANGIRDTSFGANGTVQISFGGLGSRAYDVAVQKNNRIVVVGEKTDNAGVQTAIIARLASNGAPDDSFGNGGLLNVFPMPGNSASSVALQNDGKIVVGALYNSSNVILLRYLGDAVNSNPRFDFDGDGRADVAVFRPTNGTWYLLNSANGFGAVPFGLSQDQIAAADFDGDRKTDIAVYRQSIGEWTVLRSATNTFQVVNFGTNGDLPRPGDFDGDGRADIALFRPSNGFWYWLNSSDGHFRFAQFGQNGDAPLIADFDDDGKSDLAVYRPTAGAWYWRRSSDNAAQGLAFGASEDLAVPADYDGDGKTDLAVWRPSNGIWYVRRSLLGLTGVQFGQAGDRPTAADYDGDGRADVAVFRLSNGTWYFSPSATGGFNAVQFGLSSDKPIPSAFTP